MHFFHLFMVRTALKIAGRRNGNPPEVAELLADPAKFRKWHDDHFRPKYAATTDGHLFYGATNAGALPQGFLINILNWIMTNFPAILQDIIQVLNLFKTHAMMLAASPAAALHVPSWHETLDIVKTFLPSFAAIATDYFAGASATALITKYGPQEIELFEAALHQLAA